MLQRFVKRSGGRKGCAGATRSPRTFRLTLRLAIAALALAAVGPVLGADDHRFGDGSFTDNPDLLRQGFGADAVRYEVGHEPPLEPYAPYYDIDWSVGLRGSYLSTEDGGKLGTEISPHVEFTHQGGRWRSSLELDAGIAWSEGDKELRFASLGAAATFAYQLDSNTGLTANLSLGLAQDRPDDGEIAAPQVWSWGGDVTLDRSAGRFDFSLRGSYGRNANGPTTLSDAPFTVDNSAQDYATIAGGLRIGTALTPVIRPFIDGSVSRDAFDNPSSGTGTKLDATSYSGLAGLTLRLPNEMTLEASAGLVLRDFADPAIADVTATLWNARVSYTPDDDWTLTGAFSTTLTPPAVGDDGVATLAYTADASVTYVVNPRWTLRGQGTWNASQAIGAPTTSWGYSVGAGADFKVNAHTALSGDYLYEWSETAPDPGEAEHRFTLSLTLSR